jgi:hypothetical protein
MCGSVNRLSIYQYIIYVSLYGIQIALLFSSYWREGIIVNIRHILFNGLCMAFIMSMCMSFVMAVINVGLNGHLVMPWLIGWLIGFIVSLPLSFVLPPLLHKIIVRLKI